MVVPRVGPPPPEVLSLFHPVVGEWFRTRLGEPTEVQRRAWPEIAAGRHALITAPTGSGKTLTAFLWALDRLLTGAWSAGATRVLYVSPLKALNNDIQRNLLGPLGELEAAFRAAGIEVPALQVMTRSGDTPGVERRRMLRRPPEILITTPESLNILLTSRGGRALLGGLATVILDEIHAVVTSKRGTHLITAVDRLVPLSGEVQRLALSATVHPLKRVARFVGGFQRVATGEGGAHYRARPVAIVEAPGAKRFDLRVSSPAPLAAPGPLAAERGPSRWDGLAAAFRERVAANRSTLLFANSRRLTEKVTRLINDGQERELAYSHHGSLAREIRTVVEERLKQGRLPAIVATNSLELGIDIGTLDEVLLIGTPRSVASALQRIGRAGHQVGEESRGRFYPIHPRDFLDAAVVAPAVAAQAIEEVEPLRGCLDVLAQVVLSMLVAEPWDLDELYEQLCASYPYRGLKRRELDLVLEMLAGRYADSRLRELEPRISIDRVANTARARPGAERLLYASGGTIPDRGYFHLRLEGSMAKLGELDEEFVWERAVGDTFVLGAQSWRIRQITHNDVLVAPSSGGGAMAPFWRADAQDRGFELSERIGLFLERLEERLRGGDGEVELGEWLQREHLLEPGAAQVLLDLVREQRAVTGCPLPHRHHLVAEYCSDPQAPEGTRQLIVHTTWGGRVNRPLAIALSAAWEKRFGSPPQISQDDDCLVIEIHDGFDLDDLFSLVDHGRIEELLRERLERTGFFGARFRVNAGCALLLPRSDRRRRQPLWLIRQRSKKLLEAVSRYQDFPIVLETWRSCLEDEFELDALKRLLREVEQGEIRISTAHTSRPSPLAANVAWAETNRLMYADDTPEGPGGPGLRADLLRELVFSSELRPRLASALLERFQSKLHRTSPGYPPATPDELLDWVKERLLLPRAEWRELLAAVARDAPGAVGELLAPLADRLLGLRLPGADAAGAVVAVESIPRLLAALGVERSEVVLSSPLAPEDPPPEAALAALEQLARRRTAAGEAPAEGDPREELLAEWARFYGPFRRELLIDAFGLDDAGLREALESLVGSGRWVIDHFRVAGEAEAELEICDADNLERLLRLVRTEARPAFTPLALERLPLWLATQQGLTGRGTADDDLRTALERLFGYPAPAASWEGDLLPARLDPYYTRWLDDLLRDSELAWFGCGRERISFAFASDLYLFRETPGSGADGGGGARDLFPDPRGKFGLGDLARHCGLPSGELGGRLWQEAWAGEVSNTSIEPLRKGILSRFRPAPLTTDGGPTPGRRPARLARRGRFDRWQASRPFQGDWYLLAPEVESEPLDALEREELARERARLLLERYGVLFRELLARELPALQWSALFRSLRIMELGGEVLAGCFFTGIPGLQFASPGALRALSRGLPDDAVYWMSAVDPAAPCGLPLEGFQGQVPPRLPSHHLVYHGARLVIVSRRQGGELDIAVEPDHPRLPDYLDVLKVLLTRQFKPLKLVEVELVNGEPAAESPWAPALAAAFNATRDYKSVKLRRRYGS